MAAYNPDGAEPPGTPGRDEGYLFWGAWLGHNSGSVFQVQDAHGVDRRIYLTIGCDEALSLLGASPLAPGGHRPAAAVRAGRAVRGGLLMQKSAPSIGRVLIAVGFTLSCFLLLLFLWVSFGGPVPLKPESYRIDAYFPEATQLATESDVRIGGVSVGKVKSVELAPVDKQIDGQDTSRRRDGDRARVRTDLERRAGDPAPEDAARGDLRRAHRGQRARRAPARRSRSGRRPTTTDASTDERRVDPRGGIARPRAGPGPDADRRDLQRARQGDAGPPSSSGSRGRRSRSAGAASTSTTRSATSGRSSATPRTCSRCCVASATSSRASSATPGRSSTR